MLVMWLKLVVFDYSEVQYSSLELKKKFFYKNKIHIAIYF